MSYLQNKMPNIFETLFIVLSAILLSFFIMFFGAEAPLLILLSPMILLPLFMSIIKKPKFFLYAYLAYFSFGILFLSSLGYENIGFSIGATNISLKFIVVIFLFICFGLQFTKNKTTNSQNLNQFMMHSGCQTLVFFQLSLVAVLILQVLIWGGVSPLYALQKGRDDLAYFFILYLLFILFDKEEDIWAIYKIIVLLSIISSAVSYFSGGTEEVIRGEYSLSRIEGLYVGANSFAIFISMLLPHLYYRMVENKGKYYLFYLLLLIAGSVMVIRTGTRAAYIALAIAGIFIFWFENKIKFRFFFIIATTSIFLFSYDILAQLFVKDLALGNVNTFEYRINEIWLPSVKFMVKDFHLWIGVIDRDFVSFLNRISGLAMASHNILIKLFVKYGIICTVLWILFWYKLLIKSILLIKRSAQYKHRNLQIASTLSILIFLIGSQSATIAMPFFLNIVFLNVYIILKVMETKKISNNEFIRSPV